MSLCLLSTSHHNFIKEDFINSNDIINYSLSKIIISLLKHY